MALIGQPVPRKEDDRLLCGKGCYSDDVHLPGQAYAQVVRSPHAHARIVSISFDSSMPGVVAVLTGRDALADGLKPIPFKPISPNPHEVPLKNRDGSPVFIAPCPLLATDKARHVGQAVAFVIAETLAAARDAADRIEVRYEPLPNVTGTLQAPADPAPRIWEDRASNIAVDCEAGDAAAARAAFARAAHVVRLETRINRVTGVPMEPRAALAEFDPATGRYTVHASSAGVQKHKADLAETLGVPESAVRLVTRELGGNYGTRNNFYPEYALVAWAARRVGRPVKWTCERQEAFLSDEHARDLAVQAELALDEAGRILGYRSVNTSNVGAYAVSFVPLAKGIGVSTSVYRVPATSIRGRAVHSNTAPTTSYRASGRPEVMFVMERLLDLAARRHGFDRLELRRRNLIAVREMPYRNSFGLVYDSGDYAAAQERAETLADWPGFESRRREAKARGKMRGIGLGHYIELNTGTPRERAEMTVRPEGRVDVVIGTLSSGQGHETSFAQVIADWLHVDLAQVHLLTGDTDVAAVGGGSHSGRSMRMAAAVLRQACDRVIERGKEIAAEKLEVSARDLVFRNGAFVVEGTDRSMGLFQAAGHAPLSGLHDETTPLPSFPYGCAVCEVEIDPETGVVEIARYTSVDDCGRAVNPLIVHGQTHGGIAAGVGQALWEHCVYEPATGQLLSATFMDYVLPRADQFPMFATEISEVPSTTHPLGMRGAGEGGTTPALATVANAICDALDIEHIELPATPEKVWRLANPQ